ncbi:cytochrome P450 [Sphingobium subterraneum]|uniref:Cytochrome P450 n=1 Tax=Sphingobium subterraneum TaxID=627688 RepID=A0A841J466_9SPHN|nr:cytochrome P450 [Sphingobium subterraneum]MBB6123375.1 cytochrome P450 [Sphingobium subterraneum]
MDASNHILSLDQDPFSEIATFHRDCHARYDRVRDKGVAFSPSFNAWIVFKHNLLHDFFGAPESFPVIPMGQDAPEPARTMLRLNMLANNGEAHRRHRSLVQGFFTPQAVRKLERDIEKIVDEELAVMAERGEMDAVRDFSFRLPVRVIVHMLGVPLDRADDFSTWGNWLVKIGDPSFDHLPHAATIEKVFGEMLDFLREQIEDREKSPKDDLITHLVAQKATQPWLTFDDIWTSITFILTAGHETTTNLISSGILTLLKNPDQLARLKGDMSLLDLCIDELARYEGPVSIAVPRIASHDVTLGSTSIKAGDVIIACLQAANRDPEIFDNPHQFDIFRKEKSSISFGYGPHFCLGKHLARLEAKVALRQLFTQFPDLRVDAAEMENPVWQPLIQTRGLKSLRLYAS